MSLSLTTNLIISTLLFEEIFFKILINLHAEFKIVILFNRKNVTIMDMHGKENNIQLTIHKLNVMVEFMFS